MAMARPPIQRWIDRPTLAERSRKHIVSVCMLHVCWHWQIHSFTIQYPTVCGSNSAVNNVVYPKSWSMPVAIVHIFFLCCLHSDGSVSKPIVPLFCSHQKIAGFKWMFIPLKMLWFHRYWSIPRSMAVPTLQETKVFHSLMEDGRNLGRWSAAGGAVKTLGNWQW